MSKHDVLRIPDYLEHILEAIERIDRPLDQMVCVTQKIQEWFIQRAKALEIN